MPIGMDIILTGMFFTGDLVAVVSNQQTKIIRYDTA
jgi:hypothetical protein